MLLEIIKLVAAMLLTLLDLAAFPVGIFCLYGGPEANAFCAEAMEPSAIFCTPERAAWTI